jgi:hypothetical protein
VCERERERERGKTGGHRQTDSIQTQYSMCACARARARVRACVRVHQRDSIKESVWIYIYIAVTNFVSMCVYYRSLGGIDETRTRTRTHTYTGTLRPSDLSIHPLFLYIIIYINIIIYKSIKLLHHSLLPAFSVYMEYTV